MDILNITQPPLVDNSIIDLEYHNYQPFVTSTFEYNDEIRIPIQELDAYTLPCESILYLEGSLTTDDGKTPTKLKLINNAFAYIFREVRYELNGVVVDSTRNVGLTSTLKGYLSYNENESVKLQNAGWFPKTKVLPFTNEFNVCIPLKMLMGFFEDYKKIILNMKKELVLIRNSDDLDAVTATDETEKPKINIEKLYWRVPHVSVAIAQQLQLTKILDKNVEILLPFRSWELVEYSSMPETTRHTWPVKTTTKLETPRHIVVAFQTDKKSKNFLKLGEISLQRIFLDFNNEKYATLYEMFSNFRASYYESGNEPIFNPTEFKDISPVAHIDCSRQKETVQQGSVVLRIELETAKNTPKDTTAYCLILYDRVFRYSPLTKIFIMISQYHQMLADHLRKLEELKQLIDTYCLKELAAYDGERICHYIFKPPFPFDMLPRQHQNEANWLIKNHHHINWNIGFTPLHTFNSIVEDLTKKVDTIYIKGKEKADYIRQFTSKPVFELEEQPRLQQCASKCFYHTQNVSMCALSNSKGMLLGNAIWYLTSSGRYLNTYPSSPNLSTFTRLYIQHGPQMVGVGINQYAKNNLKRLFSRHVDDLKRSLTRQVIDQISLEVKQVIGTGISQTEKELSDVKSFNTANKVITPSSDLQKIFEEFINEILAQASEFQEKNCGWTLKQIMFLDVNINKFNPIAVSSYIKLPKAIENKKAVLNIQNNDMACFAWSVNAALFPSQGDPTATSSYPHYDTLLNFTNLEFPIKLKDIHRFEKMNNISINVFGVETEYKDGKYVTEVVGPLHFTKQRQPTHVNLLLVSDGEGNNHYCLISDLSRLVSSQKSKCHGKIYFCDGCLQSFSTINHLKQHEKNDCYHLCTKIATTYPKLNKYGETVPENILKFVNFEKQLPVPFVIYADFECILKPIQGNEPLDDKPFTV
ncbi:hypothetical protein NQ315_010975 [Exocentrus adspersus]|uniref:C2H2-type domain-containing protein n=1 Tax=Exocentrus adspersus TaxID=1586481 RepID=A0AAV8VGB0_9CUCU|nr:hypothetical protein NQ315_010975 [Exocentrus adspersus]